MIKKMIVLFIYFFFGITLVSAKEINFYFYPNNGVVKTDGFELGDYGYLSYKGNYFAEYTDKDTIKKSIV